MENYFTTLQYNEWIEMVGNWVDTENGEDIMNEDLGEVL